MLGIATAVSLLWQPALGEGKTWTRSSWALILVPGLIAIAGAWKAGPATSLHSPEFAIELRAASVFGISASSSFACTLLIGAARGAGLCLRQFRADQCPLRHHPRCQRCQKPHCSTRAASGSNPTPADLCIGGVGRATAHGQGSNQGRGPDEMTIFAAWCVPFRRRWRAGPVPSRLAAGGPWPGFTGMNRCRPVRCQPWACASVGGNMGWDGLAHTGRGVHRGLVASRNHQG